MSSETVSEPIGMRAERILLSSLRVYTDRAERVAMRCALGDAAALCDALAEQTKRQNSYSGGRVTQVGQTLAEAVKTAGDAIWAMREMIDVTTPATPKVTAAVPEQQTEPPK